MVRRWLVIFQSDHEAPFDAHFVDVYASSMIGAVRNAQMTRPPLHTWVLARAQPWPRGCYGVDAAVKKLSGTKR